MPRIAERLARGRPDALLDGTRERRLHASRPGFDDLPWDSFDASRVDPEDLVDARQVWTNGVFTEYASAAAFSTMNVAFLQCGAPVDLCAAAADFAVDELVHVTLVSRLVMTLGGATPYLADLEQTPHHAAYMEAAVEHRIVRRLAKAGIQVRLPDDGSGRS